MEGKICPDCKEFKPRTEYLTSKLRKDGLSTYCHECRKKQSKMAYRFGRKTDRPWGVVRDFPDGTRECSCCGQRKVMEEFSPTERNATGREKRCRECMAKKTRAYNRTVGGQYVFARGIARRNGREFTLTREQYAALRCQTCAYCGFDLAPTGIGLDRKDNERGYSSDNVLPCCFECNQARGNIFTVQEMYLIGKAIAEVKRKRLQEDSPRDEAAVTTRRATDGLCNRLSSG